MSAVNITISSSSNELWRLIRQEWYSEDEDGIELSLDCLDLRKDMQPPETSISFNESKSNIYYEKIYQVMEDLFLKMSIKGEHLFAGLIDEEVYKIINKREKVIEFVRDRGDNNSHFGLYYLTSDETKLLAAKTRLINFLEKKLTMTISKDKHLSQHLEILKNRRKEIDKEVKRIKNLVKNHIKDSCNKLKIDCIKIQVDENGVINLISKDVFSADIYCQLNKSIQEISPLELVKNDKFPDDINHALSRIESIKII